MPFQSGNADKVSLMMAYQCDNEALDDIRQYGMVDTTHAASDGCKRQVSRTTDILTFRGSSCMTRASSEYSNNPNIRI